MLSDNFTMGECPDICPISKLLIQNNILLLVRKLHAPRFWLLLAILIAPRVEYVHKPVNQRCQSPKRAPIMKPLITTNMRSILAIAAMTLLALPALLVSAGEKPFPKKVPALFGSLPEGFAIGRGATAFNIQPTTGMLCLCPMASPVSPWPPRPLPSPVSWPTGFSATGWYRLTAHSVATLMDGETSACLPWRRRSNSA